MKNIILLGLLVPFLSFAQINNKIEGLTIDTSCELEYTKNLGNQNNYSCVFQGDNEKVLQYSVTVQNLFEDMNGLSEATLSVFKEEFLKGLVSNAEASNQDVKSIYLSNGQRAILMTSYLTYSGHKFINTSIGFLYKQKSFIVNLTTNNLEKKTNLIKRIKIK
jgi:hypothetical protein